MLTASQITNLYLYGTITTPNDKIMHDWLRDTAHVTNHTMQYADYMQTAGKFAKGSQFELIQEFFAQASTLSAGTYTIGGANDIFQALGISA